jgi:hypothetical protein
MSIAENGARVVIVGATGMVGGPCGVITSEELARAMLLVGLDKTEAGDRPVLENRGIQKVVRP